MEKITIEKILKFDNTIDSISIINIDDNLRYNVLDDNTHAEGKLLISGSLNTIIGPKEFNEDIDVDIYAPFDKKLDKDNFKIKVIDYTYEVKNKSLIIYITLKIEGIIDSIMKEQKSNESIIDEINMLNEINDEVETVNSVRNEEVKVIEEIKEIKSNNVNIIENQASNNNINTSGLVNMNSSYVIFHKFKV